MAVPRGRSEARYRAFLSYSRADLKTARSLQRRLERFVVPGSVRRSLGERRGRLSPIFRDEADLATSGILHDKLRAAIDDSAAMILLASPASVRSPYVDLEVEHFVRARGIANLAIVAIGEGGQRNPPLPDALADFGDGPLWIDCRDQREVSRRALVRIIAAVLGVDFDLVWGRHRRRRRQLLAAWAGLIALVAALVGGALWNQNVAEQRRPERQIADFRDWLAAKHHIPDDDPSVVIVRTDDLDEDGLIDYVVQNNLPQFCGSGGCVMSVYVTRAPGDYHEVLSVLGDTSPRVRDAAGGGKQIIITELQVDGEPVYSVYELRGDRALLTSYEFCDGVYFEYCRPRIVEPTPGRDTALDPTLVVPGTVLRQGPDPSAEPLPPGYQQSAADSGVRVVGVLAGGGWHLVHFVPNVAVGHAGFVPSGALQR